MKIIPLTKGFSTIIDDEDYELFCRFKWTANVTRQDKVYVVRGTKEKKKIFLHREISKCPSELVVDHINGDTLDNRRSNLRCVSKRINTLNAKNLSRNTSGYRGVSFSKETKKWVAKLEVSSNGQRNTICLGSYNSPELAFEAYKKKFSELYGNLEMVWLK